MKPDWKDAPAWANYLAEDDDGEWFWYEFSPRRRDNDWYPSKGRSEKVKYRSKAWKESLEERP